MQYVDVLWFQEGFEGQMTEDNLEIGICNADGFRRLSPQATKANAALSKSRDMFWLLIDQEVKDYLANIQ